MNNFWKTPNG